MEELEGRTAVVIGGGGGIGRGIALGLAGAGTNVIVADIDPATAAAVADEITGAGGRAASHRVDATDVASLTTLADAAVEEFGAVHVLANVVGVIVDRRLDTATEADWAWFVDFNLMATVRAVNTFLPLLRAHDEAHIVNTASMAGLVALAPELTGGVSNGLYTTSKYAMVGYTEYLRGELAPEGIGVSVLCPGLVAGNLSSTSARNRPSRFGGPFDDPRAGRTAPPSAMPNEQIGPMIVAGIRQNRRFVLTHPDAVDLVAARHAELLADADAYRAL